MLFKFTGKYTGGRTSITVFGVTFHGHKPADVTDADGIRRLSGHPEFEAATKYVIPPGLKGDEGITEGWIEDNLGSAAASATQEYRLDAPKKRGRPRK